MLLQACHCFQRLRGGFQRRPTVVPHETAVSDALHSRMFFSAVTVDALLMKRAILRTGRVHKGDASISEGQRFAEMREYDAHIWSLRTVVRTVSGLAWRAACHAVEKCVVVSHVYCYPYMLCDPMRVILVRITSHT